MKTARQIIEEQTATAAPLSAEPKAEVKAPEAKKEITIVPMDSDSRFIYKNQEDLRKAAAWAIFQKLPPSNLIKDGVEAVMTAISICHSHKLPYTAMQKMFYYKGNITIWGDLYNALAERHPRFGDKREYWIDKDYNKVCPENKNIGKEWAALCEVKPKGNTEFIQYYFSLDDAAKAGLYPAMKWDNGKKVESPDSPWNKYTRDMMMWKARTRAYKANYSESLQGLECHEDVRELMERDVTPNDIDKNAKALNEAF